MPARNAAAATVIFKKQLWLELDKCGENLRARVHVHKNLSFSSNPYPKH